MSGTQSADKEMNQYLQALTEAVLFLLLWRAALTNYWESNVQFHIPHINGNWIKINLIFFSVSHSENRRFVFCVMLHPEARQAKYLIS